MHIEQLRRKRQIHSRAHGQVLAEGAAAILLMVMTFVLALLLVLNIGAIVYYKMKLSLVTTQTAAYASSLIAPSTLTWAHNRMPSYSTTALAAQSTAYAQTLLAQMGLIGSGSPPVVSVTYNPLYSDTLLVTVNVTISSLPLFGKNTVLPSFFTLQDTAQGVARYDEPPGIAGYIVPGTAPPLGSIFIYGPGYGFAPGGVTGAAGLDVMNLRSGDFYTAPSIIKMGIPSASSGSPGLGSGIMIEVWEPSGTANLLMGGTTYF